ncbi:virion structural protein [Baekduia alba]|uniref:N,N-dimethylformamidase beta subunit family domain-containing protein n=1 Tax=Baekduia alba TaxID=2997333 RepID=UPI002341D3C1|nr:N,N-dimethylformamidase beta subunit family domain-containing protein [Baekduia alba]WCB95824.1 virion structural protein [Baekduia alba]
MTRPTFAALLTFLALALLPAAASAASAPTGASTFPTDAKVVVSWQPSSGATAYTVYRGTSAAAITTRVTTAAGVTGTSFTDTTALNGTTYFYAARAVQSGIESGNSNVVTATPGARACTTGNAVVLENCLPGSAGWKLTAPAIIANGGIEGYATAQSVNHGSKIDLKVNATAGSTFDAQVYRMGSYGGLGGRLVTTLKGVGSTAQPSCSNDDSTGLYECANWSVSATISTTTDWPSGMYLVRLLRNDTAKDNYVLFTVRDDSRTPALVYGSSYGTFQAYNMFGGRSLYTFNSNGANTVSGQARAVKVSFDRPYEQPRARQHDWFVETEQPVVAWLEQQGDDVSYIADTDLETQPQLARQGGAYYVPPHDEYFSAGMRSALEAARSAGTDIFFSGANAVYEKVRFEASPQSGVSGRTMTCYKTTESGPADPSGIPTGTWRDPLGANKPENALIGQMFIGQSVNLFFPFRVSATEGSDRLYRYTGLDGQASGATASIGANIMGWEWDGRVANGQEPAGVKTLATSPVTGDLVQNNGQSFSPGAASPTMTKYTAASGALVVSTGTIQWWRGLSTNTFGEGEPNLVIQQITTNVLADMGVKPGTPATGMQVDTPTSEIPVPTNVNATAVGPDAASVSWAAVAGATGYNVYRTTYTREGGYPLGQRANMVAASGTSFTDDGLSSGKTYHYVVTAIVGGKQSAPSAEAFATTPLTGVTSKRINAGGLAYTTFTGVSWLADSSFSGGFTYHIPDAISGTTDPALAQDEHAGTFSYNIPVPSGKYDVRLHFAELYWGTGGPGGAGKRAFNVDVAGTAAAPDLSNLDIYSEVGPRTALVKTIPNVTVTSGTLSIAFSNGSADQPEVTAVEVVPSVPSGPPAVTQVNPGDTATGIAATTTPTATFSRAMDASTITGSTFTLTPSGGGAAVAASVAYDAATQTATLTPTSTLDFSTTYVAKLTTAVKASDGQALPNAVTWSFATMAAPAPPSVTGATPAAGATDVPVSTKPTATFSRAMMASTVTSSSFTLEKSGGAVVTASVAYAPATFTATLTPSAALAYSTTYVARIKTTIKSADGVALPAEVTRTFTTSAAPPPDTTPPTVAVTSPSAGASVTGTVSLAANAADNVGVTGVQFRLDGASIGAEDTSAPYTYAWDSLSTANGPHTITAVAKDAAGNSTTAANVAITVNHPAVDQSGLVGAWGFDEASGTTATDSSTAHNNGTINGPVRTASGKFGGALTFDGTNDLVTVPDATSLHLGSAVTLEAWVYPTALNDWRTILIKERGTNALTWGLYGNTDTGRPSANASTAGSEKDTRGTAALGLNAWTHVAQTYDGATLKLFINGTLVSSRAMTGALDSSTSPLGIGGNGVWGEFFQGRLDEVRVYSRALSAAEVGTDMNLPVDHDAAPTAPTALTATASADAVALDWNAATDDNGVTGYEVYRSTTSGFTPSAANHVATVNSATAYTDTALAPGTYYYVVTATDASDNESNPSGQASATVTADTTAPTVTVTAPAAGATVSGSAVALTATATDNRSVASVQFKVDGTDVGSADTTAPYAANWSTLSATNATHSITAVAKDAAGNATSSAAVSVTVNNGTPPTVALTAPAAGATVTGATTISATAGDDRGVTQVQFKVDGTDVGAPDTSSPYSISWSSATVANGTHSITAVASDTDGNTTTSAARSVTASNSSPAPTGLVASYGFDEATGTTANDGSGKGHAGTIDGPIRAATGKFGGALSFDGVNDLVTVPDAADLDLTTGLTMEAWVDPSVLSGWRTVVLKEQSAGMVYGLYANTDTNRPSGHVSTPSETDTRGTAQMALNTWTHLAVTYDGSTLRLYVNGTLASSKAVTGAMPAGTQPLRIGGNAIWGEYFGGLIDEVRIYNRALSSVEIGSDMTRAVADS